LKENPEIRSLVSEFTKFIKVLLTIPGSSCSNERSFSALRRLKTYLRATMLQKRLNNIAILNIYRDIAQNLDLELLMNDFIIKNKMRTATFAL
ncbi:hypothetical protein ALC57_08606, partial [Trachymyrmex cornetzi]